MCKIVLLRHGDSTWNQTNRRIGRSDIGRIETGMTEAIAARGKAQA